MLVDGGISSSMFNYFIISLIKKYKSLNDEDRLVIICDNARIHHSPMLKSISKKVNIIYLPPYTSVFSSIELFFNVIK